MIEVSNNEYSGAVQEGWNPNGSYNRLQFFANDIVSEEEFCEIVEEGLSEITGTQNTRLDVRCFVSDNFDISYIKNKYNDADIAVRNVDEKDFILFGVNIGERKLAEEKINYIKDIINSKIDNVLSNIEGNGGFENHALSIINNAIIRGFSFERENFGVEEVFELWGFNFGWSREEISSFIDGNTMNDKMFGLRNRQGVLISLIMIGEDFETTEWSVIKNYQGTGTIEPLLIATNGILIDSGRAENVYAHMRWNRSIGPGLKSGLRINNSNGVDNLLTNLVEVEGNMEHFLEGTLDTDLYTQSLLEYIRNFTR